MSVATPAPPKPPPHQVTYLVTPGEGGAGGQRTFQNESALPPLPVLPLQDTLDLYLSSVQPHLTKEELEVTKRTVNTFATGLGPRLQEKLLQRQKKKRNWLEDWWLQTAYLLSRHPLLPSTNTSGPHPLSLTLWHPREEHALEYGSLYLWALLDFHQALREERFKPHVNREGMPLSMEQFRWIFNCTRIPGQKVDTLRFSWLTKEEGECPMHVIVLCKGHIWSLYPWDAQGQPLTPPELEVLLRQVWGRCEGGGEGPGLGALTCDRRDTWAENRQWLMSLSLKNAKNLEVIESSSFVFVLDQSTPGNLSEVVWEGLCGDVKNRWADKSCSAILTKNGYVMSNNDHTPYDAMVTVVVSHYQHLLLQPSGGRWGGERGVRSGLPPPQELTFDLDGKLLKAIEDAKVTSRSYTSNIATHPFIFTEYGRNFLRPHQLHPDTYVQMALQLAFLRVHGRPPPTYETASTRLFHHGRTETIRSCTQEATDWAMAMLDPAVSAAERRRLLRAAVSRHNALRDRCEQGLGADRHLLALYLLALEEEEEVPPLFTDPAFAKSGGGGQFHLSTSTLGYTEGCGGVAAMTPDGYGCFYSIMADRLIFFVTSYASSGESDGPAFVSAITDSLRDMQRLLTHRSAL